MSTTKDLHPLIPGVQKVWTILGTDSFVSFFIGAEIVGFACIQYLTMQNQESLAI